MELETMGKNISIHYPLSQVLLSLDQELTEVGKYRGLRETHMPSIDPPLTIW